MSLPESIPLRLAKINQYIDGKAHSASINRTVLSKDGLLDSLIALHDECSKKYSSTCKNPPKHITAFQNRITGTIEEVKKLRVNVSDFQTIQIIGQGHFGQVRVVKEKVTGDVFALKSIRKCDILSHQENSSTNNQKAACFEEERDIMSSSNNTWLTQLQYAFQDDNYLYIAMDFHPGGDLAIVLNRYETLTEDMARFYVAEMTLAIQVVHSLGYVHRDIKPDNFLVDRIGHLKLTDFGSAAKMNADGLVVGKMPVGSPDYIAPELLSSMTSSEDKPYSRLVDWWSLGIIVYEMVCGKLPFSDAASVVNTYSNILKYKEKLKFPSSIELSSPVRSFVSGLLVDAKDRMNYDQITAHELLADIDLTNIRNTTPPYIPKLSSNDDTSNFDEVEPRPHSPRDSADLPDFKDLPFVGFTCYRNLALIKARHGSVTSSSSNLLDMLFSPSTDGHDGCNRKELLQMEKKEATLRKEMLEWCDILEKMREVMKQKDALINKLENAKETQDKEMAYLYATNADLSDEIKKLSNALNSTREVYEKVLGETEDFMHVLHSREKDQNEYEDVMSQELERLKCELDMMDKVVVEKDVKIAGLTKKVERTEKECSRLVNELESQKQRADALQKQLADLQKADRRGTLVVKCEIETQHVKREVQVSELQRKLDETLASNKSAMETLERLKHEKQQLELELDSIKAVSARRQADRKTEMDKNSLSETEKLKLSKLEVKNAQLNSEITEKSSLTQQLHMRISDLSDQVEDAKKQCLLEKDARVKIEKSLRDRIQELEGQLVCAQRDGERLRGHNYSVYDNATEHKRIVSEQEQTIALLKANVEKLENLVVGMRDGFEEQEHRRDQRGRQETRRWAEIVGELKQENIYLERKIELLNNQLQAKVDYEESHKTRLKLARDELQQIKEKSEAEVADLKKRLLEAEMSLTDAKSESANKSQAERTLRRQFENLQKHVKDEEDLHEQRLQDIQNEKQTLLAQIELLKEENTLIDELDAELLRLSQRIATLETENRSSRDQAKRAEDSKIQAILKLDRLETDAKNSERNTDRINEELRQLKLVCGEMDHNSQDLEKLVEEYEKKEEQYLKEKRELEANVTRLENKSERLEASLQAERSQRQVIDERNERTKQTLNNQIVTHRNKEESLLKELQQQSINVDRLRKQTQENENEIAKLDQDRRAFKVRLSQAEEEIRKLKEEASTWKSQVENLKAINCRLTSDNEILADKIDDILNSKYRVENTVENLILTREHEKYKSEQMLSQQTKLIDFLQEKYEVPMKTKKIFSNRKKEGNRDEFVLALENERTRNRKLQDEVNDLKTELFNNKVAGMKSNKEPSFSTPQSGRVPPEGKSAQTPATMTPVKQKPVTTEQKVMKHNIPHRFSLGLNTRATKCGVCQESVMFGKQAAKCQECRVVTHEKCRSELPSTCGLPSQFIQLFEKTLEKKSFNSTGGVLEADLKLVELGGWMKVRGLEKASSWEKRFVLLENQTLSFYLTDDTSCKPLHSINLIPTKYSTKVILISDINPAELPGISGYDLPYILKLELTSGELSKSVYLLTANFEEKEKWDSTLEAIISKGSLVEVDKESKLKGNRLLRIDGDSLGEINCTTLIGENDILLLGTHSGLFACQLSYTSEPLIKVEGVSVVYQMSCLLALDQLIMITGPKRWLSYASFSSLKGKLLSSHNSITGSVRITIANIGDITGCVMHTVAEINGKCTVIAATSDYLSIITYSNSKQEFNVIQEVNLVEPCSCLCYSPEFVLFGTDTVYKLSINNGVIRPFLAHGVKPETSYNSLPIEILLVSPQGSPHKEFLCCFTDVGVFVDSSGKKTREEEIQWSGLPLSFAYRDPYLYVIYYKAMQVIGPINDTTSNWRNLQTFLNIQSPRYLGPAYTDGAVYIASQQEKCTDILVFKGNLQALSLATDSGCDESVTSEADSGHYYLSQEKKVNEFYQRENKENSSHRNVASYVRRPLPVPQSPSISPASSNWSLTSTESIPSKPRNPLNTDYFNRMYGSSKKKASDL